MGMICRILGHFQKTSVDINGRPEKFAPASFSVSRGMDSVVGQAPGVIISAASGSHGQMAEPKVIDPSKPARIGRPIEDGTPKNSRHNHRDAMPHHQMVKGPMKARAQPDTSEFSGILLRDFLQDLPFFIHYPMVAKCHDDLRMLLQVSEHLRKKGWLPRVIIIQAGDIFAAGRLKAGVVVQRGAKPCRITPVVDSRIADSGDIIPGFITACVIGHNDLEVLERLRQRVGNGGWKKAQALIERDDYGNLWNSLKFRGAPFPAFFTI